MEEIQWWSITGLGCLTLLGAFWKMQGGFGPFNLRVIGLVLIATLVTLLALHDSGSVTSAMGILGAIVGYLLSDKH